MCVPTNTSATGVFQLKFVLLGRDESSVPHVPPSTIDFAETHEFMDIASILFQKLQCLLKLMIPERGSAPPPITVSKEADGSINGVLKMVLSAM